MIRAFVFDLDGTLVETEMLKARAYAEVAKELLGSADYDQRAIGLYRRLTGNTDETVARAMVSELGLEAALARSGKTGELWERLHQLRTEVYVQRVGTTDAIRASAYPHAIALLVRQKKAGRMTAVATSSYRQEALRVLEILGALEYLDLVVGRDGIIRPKPNPEIYLTTMRRLGCEPSETVLVEDSTVGLDAAIASGARWICIANEFTRTSLKAKTGLDQSRVVYDAATLDSAVERLLAES